MTLFFIFFFVIINFVLFKNIEKICIKFNLIDRPDNINKIHKNNIPLGGGIILIINILFYNIFNFYLPNFETLTFLTNEKVSFFIGSFLIFLIGIYDDKFILKANTKLILLILALLSILFIYEDNNLVSLKFSFTNYQIDFVEYKLIFTLICYLCFLNAFNMFDGINFQVSSYSIFIVLFLIFQQFSYFFCVLLIFLTFFSYHNLKNKIFMGDNGSLLLSFILGFILIKFYNQKIIIYADQIFLLMSLPGLDLIRLFFIRILNRKNPFVGDLNHFHHILLKSFPINKYYFIMIFLIVIPNLFFVFSKNFILSFVMLVVPYILIINFSKRKKNN